MSRAITTPVPLEATSAAEKLLARARPRHKAELKMLAEALRGLKQIHPRADGTSSIPLNGGLVLLTATDPCGEVRQLLITDTEHMNGVKV